MNVKNQEILQSKTLVLLDGNALMHRAYHGVNKNFLPTWQGMPVGMVYGFASMFLNIVDFYHPEALFITFDTKEKTFRHEMDTEYKAHRQKAPDDFYAQIPLLNEFLDAIDVPVFRCPGFESDDIIGTIATHAPQEFSVKILSGDLDFTQLVNDQITLVKLNGKLDAAPEYGPAETKARYEVEACQMIDFKAITGDSSDNYKGIEGVGPKTAAKILNTYETLENIYEHLDELQPEKIQEKFRANKDYVFHCQKLARIATDVPVEYDFSQEFSFTEAETIAYFQKMNFRALENRYQRILKNYSGKGSAPSKVAKAPAEDQMSLF